MNYGVFLGKISNRAGIVLIWSVTHPSTGIEATALRNYLSLGGLHFKNTYNEKFPLVLIIIIIIIPFFFNFPYIPPSGIKAGSAYRYIVHHCSLQTCI